MCLLNQIRCFVFGHSFQHKEAMQGTEVLHRWQECRNCCRMFDYEGDEVNWSEGRPYYPSGPSWGLYKKRARRK